MKNRLKRCVVFFAILLAAVSGAWLLYKHWSFVPEKKATQFVCLSCALQSGEAHSIGGLIAETPYFEARQDYGVPIPGFIIIATKRHISTILDFTEDERQDFTEFVFRVRKGMQHALGINTVYLIQEEDATHFHLWLFPWYPWMSKVGKKLKSVKPIMEYARKNLMVPENMKQIEEYAERLRKYLS